MYARIWLTRRRLTMIALVAISAAGLVSAYAIETNMLLPPYTIGSSHPEILVWDNSYSITSDSGQPNPTILSMVVTNAGTVSVTIATLTIQDLTAGSSSPAFSLNGQPIPAPNVNATVTVVTFNSGFNFLNVQ